MKAPLFPIAAVPPLRTETTNAFQLFDDGTEEGRCEFGPIEHKVFPDSPRGKALRDLRVSLNLSLGAAARALGIGVVEFSALERGGMTFADEAHWEAAGDVCICVTGRSDEGRWGADVKRGIDGLMPIVFAAGTWKAGAAERAGYKVDVWIDDMPEGVRELREDFAAVKREREKEAEQGDAAVCACGHQRLHHRGALVGGCLACVLPGGDSKCHVIRAGGGA